MSTIVNKNVISGQAASLVGTGSYNARVALVMGFGDYRKAFVGKFEFDSLRNPVNDAKDMAKTLRNLGFDVILKLNLKTKAAMKKAVLEFRLRLPKTGAVGLFYFSGHGFQYQNANFLVPVQAAMPSDIDIESEALRTDYVLRHLEKANRQGVNIVILDACRDSIPSDFFDDRENKDLFAGDLKAGFTNMQAPVGSLIAYATAPNTTSWGGLPTERNSVYTKHLLKALRDKPDVNITRLLMRVRKGVIEETRTFEAQQVPWDSVSLTDPFYFAQSSVIATTPVSPPVQERFEPGNVFRDRLQDGSLGPKMVVIPAGRFRMGDIQGGGSDDEKPVHRVSIKQFAMGKYEVTFAEYDKFAQATGREKPKDRGWGRDNRPVINVSWDDAVAYAEWLSQQTGKQYRLPTEAEWEYAARAGTDTKYWWGNEIGQNRANCNGCGSRWDDKQTAPVGSFAANPFGLYDTVGNVWEWTCSEYENEYSGKEKQCISKKRAMQPVIRGGSGGHKPGGVRAASRDRNSHDDRINIVGFRLAR
ncbi:SUMF1/EgtB/PvdO family nonheme iron enzyme [Candidatus Marithioploca araucensis]|uniref:SUMF1/EgtB/PvdO family nonheme iron enzyme n=1 Tax=Candidatus Marithioploca araucensis TaxID=70273 RepID=A0ABT7VR68_9GAMM|nr:SUMF1/EgtB/PvdO family nonheme iron enzyme [Candidatus Marithioploca araucensis]